ncbi:MAG: isoprenylcysteine carboxylmethyltransferase family protein [Candidatus ainarchaeum sp.]|nr:isoprenylcysteine carboxylmethyltransferase family protein [Candidatus ainarchaeum sp.]
MANENIVLLAAYLLLVFGGGMVANMISRRKGAKLPPFFSAGGWRAVAGEFRKNLVFLAVSLIDVALMAMGALALYGGAYSLPLVALGLLAIAASMPVLFLARRDLAEGWKMSVKPGEGQRLVTAGIYSKIRHPINASFFILVLGMALVAGSPLAALLFALHSVGLLLRTRQEEKELAERFGEEYADYARKVPAFIPRL